MDVTATARGAARVCVGYLATRGCARAGLRPSLVLPARAAAAASQHPHIHARFFQRGAAGGLAAPALRSRSACSARGRGSRGLHSTAAALQIDPSMVRYSAEVREAMEGSKPIVALESTIIAHGMPYPQNMETAIKVCVPPHLRTSGNTGTHMSTARAHCGHGHDHTHTHTHTHMRTCQQQQRSAHLLPCGRSNDLAMYTGCYVICVVPCVGGGHCPRAWRDTGDGGHHRRSDSHRPGTGRAGKGGTARVHRVHENLATGSGRRRWSVPSPCRSPSDVVVRARFPPYSY